MRGECENHKRVMVSTTFCPNQNNNKCSMEEYCFGSAFAIVNNYFCPDNGGVE